METVVVERSFEAPVTFEEVQRLEDAVAWCLDAHRVRALRSYFARDRTRMVCLYEAPDAEAVRETQRQGGLPYDALWTARPYRPPSGRRAAHAAPEGAVVVVERAFDAPIAPELLARRHAEAEWCLETYRVALVDSYLRPSLDGTVCIFAAPDAEAVRNASATIGLPVARLWPATRHDAAPG